jgi:PTS system ascorbate-specific IIC component
MQQFINFLTGFFGTPAILIGIFCLVGCIIQHKSVAKTITSVVKTIIGFLIIAGGATLVAGAIGKFSTTFELLFNRSG